MIILNPYCFFCTKGQIISISSFKQIPNDITAVSHGTTVLDQNGEKCALIKIETTQTGFSFDVGSLGITKTEHQPGEIWVYVPHGVKKITISHPSFGVLRDYNFPYALKTGRTYLLTLNANKSTQSPSPQKHIIDANLSKTVLLSLNENEIIYNNEQFIDMTLDRNRFCCVLQDTITKMMSFVWNGERKLNAKNIYLSHIDLYDYEKCILMYSDTSKYYQSIKIEGNTFGPYDWIVYLADPDRQVDWKGPSMNGIDKEYRKGWPYSHIFIFGALDDGYLNINGKITPIPDKYYEWENGKRACHLKKIYEDIDTLGTSPNGNFRLQFKGDRLIGSNIDLKLPYIPTKSKDIHVYNNGKALITICNDAYEWRSYIADINAGSLHELAENECFDYKNGAIRKYPLNWNRQFERKDPKIEWDVVYNAICMQDPTLKHTLISKLNVPYVLLDNQRIGKGAALDAYYDPEKNSFSWIAYEDNSLIMYEYSL